MAIYHLEAKVVSRGTGRSAVAASAYLSCTNILNDYDGVRHDFTRKKGLVWEQVFLPEYAPTEWQDRGVLWNAVEENEKTKDSRLAREFVPALPIELTPAQWQELLTDFIRSSFVAEGMCADVAIHDPYPPGHNPHAHIMLTVRPLDEQGNWQYKTEKEYLCVRNGEERGFTAAEFKAAQADGWEKQYPYKVGRKKVYMPPSESEKHGYERANKHPKSTKFGRQNPIALLSEKKETPFYQIPKLHDLTRRIAELTEELEELKTEKEMLLRSLDCADDAGIFAVKKEIAAMEGALQKLSEQEAKYSAELDEALKQYADLKEQAADMDAVELMDARIAVREEKECSAVDRVKAAYGEKYDPIMMHDSKRDVANLLHEEAETRSIRERLRQKLQQPAQQKQTQKKSRDSWER